MNSLIETILADFTVDGVKIPVSFLFYEGHGQPYVTYQQVDSDNSIAGDNELLGWVEYYDFDVFSRGNYNGICRALFRVLEANGFRYQPSRSQGDMYETDTQYYHRTMNFAIYKGVE